LYDADQVVKLPSTALAQRLAALVREHAIEFSESIDDDAGQRLVEEAAAAPPVL
jgi:hypothetical protein